MASSGILCVELTPPNFVVIPGGHEFVEEWECRHDDGKNVPWQVKTYSTKDESGQRHGVSLHTWSHMDAPIHSIPGGLTIGQLDPAWYSILRTRVIDLSKSTAADRRQTLDNVEFHSQISADDLPSDAELDDVNALAFVTGFWPHLTTHSHHKPGTDAIWPHIDQSAAERIANLKNITMVMMDAPSVDTSATVNVAHRILLGRAPKPVLIGESFMLGRLLGPLFGIKKRTTGEVLLTLGLAPGSRADADGSWVAPTAYLPDPNSELGYAAYERLCSLMLGAVQSRV